MREVGATRKSPWGHDAPAGPRIWLRMTLLGFCALAVMALIADIRGLQERGMAGDRGRLVGANPGDRQDLILGLSAAPYREASGLFTMVPPKGWRKEEKPAGTEYDVVFLGPQKMDISLQANRVENDSFSEMLKRVWAIEKGFHADMHVETITFTGRPAVRRTIRLLTQKLLIIDFTEAGVAHHLQFSAPPELFDYYLPAVMQVLETYRPGLPQDFS